MCVVLLKLVLAQGQDTLFKNSLEENGGEDHNYIINNWSTSLLFMWALKTYAVAADLACFWRENIVDRQHAVRKNTQNGQLLSEYLLTGGELTLILCFIGRGILSS